MKLSDLIKDFFKEQGYSLYWINDGLKHYDQGKVPTYWAAIDNHIAIDIDDEENIFRIHGISAVRGHIDKTWKASDPNSINELTQALRTHCPVFKWKPLTWRPL